MLKIPQVWGRAHEMPRRSRQSKQVSRGSEPEHPRRIFLLSPANASGLRAKQVASENAQFDLAQRLRKGQAPLGEIFAFISGLYFRGKMAYSQVFARVPEDFPGAFVITAGAGLVPPGQMLTVKRLQSITRGEVHLANPRYVRPLLRDARIFKM